MPMGIVTREEFERERRDSDPTYQVSRDIMGTAKVQNMPELGRHEGSTEVPDSLRKIIGTEVIENGRSSGLEIARNFGIQPSSVSAYGKGATSTATIADRPNRDFLNRTREKISKKASKRLLSALDSLTDEKIANTKAVDTAIIAKHMSGIVKDMTPELENLDKPIPPQILVFAPQIKQEEKYEMIFANE